MAPKIGIPAVDKTAADNFKNYEKAIKEHGGETCFLIYGEQSTAEFIPGIDALLLPGGGDIHPDNFNQVWHPKLKYVDEARDELELSLFKEAIEKEIPVFGICRGIQVMSVAMGGSLYQDIESVYPREALNHKVDEDRRDSEHEIEIIPHSRLSEIVNEHQALVNSAHHQALDNIGEGFVVTARSSDGIIEAVENLSKRFVIGVQYHPERMLKKPELQEHAEKLFEAFIKAASA